MPKTREQIKHDPVSREVWIEPRTSVLWFDPRKIRPLTDHILVELDGDIPHRTPCAHDPVASRPLCNVGKAWIVRPENAVKDIGTRIGTVLAVGPGKWHEKPGESWDLTRQYFKPTQLKPGQRVAIGHYSDWESWNCSADGYESDNNIVLCQENDVRGVLS